MSDQSETNIFSNLGSLALLGGWLLPFLFKGRWDLPLSCPLSNPSSSSPVPLQPPQNPVQRISAPGYTVHFHCVLAAFELLAGYSTKDLEFKMVSG